MAQKKTPTYLMLRFEIVRMAKMAAAKMGLSLSDYIAGLVLEDSVKSGIEAFLRGDDARDDLEEAGHEEE